MKIFQLVLVFRASVARLDQVKGPSIPNSDLMRRRWPVLFRRLVLPGFNKCDNLRFEG